MPAAAGATPPAVKKSKFVKGFGVLLLIVSVLASLLFSAALFLTVESIQGRYVSIALAKMAEEKGIGSYTSEESAIDQSRLNKGKTAVWQFVLLLMLALFLSALGYWMVSAGGMQKSLYYELVVGAGVLMFLVGVGMALRSESRYNDASRFMKALWQGLGARSVSVLDTREIHEYRKWNTGVGATLAVTGVVLFLAFRKPKKRQVSWR